MKQPYQALDNLTNTFTADSAFFDALMQHPCGESYIEMCVWYLWLHEYLHDIQSSLHDAGKLYGADYQIWVISMIGGAAQGVGMLMYLLARGIVHEAASSGRRALEYIGMTSHLVRDPTKTQFLCKKKLVHLHLRKLLFEEWIVLKRRNSSKVVSRTDSQE